MRHTAGIGRLGLLAVGLGIGGAWASAPGVASASDIQISISGTDLFPTADNTATAVSSFGNIAIAIGDGANANALGSVPFLGIFNTALAVGTDSSATASLIGAFDVASAIGTGSVAGAGVGGLFDLASAIGTGSQVGAGIGGLFDLASAIGKDSSSSGFFGVGNLAAALGPDSTVGSGVGVDNLAIAGPGGLASAVGLLNAAFAAGAGSDAAAGGVLNAALALGSQVAATASGVFDLAVAEGVNAVVKAMNGFFDFAYALGTGSTTDEVYAGGIGGVLGNADTATVIGSGSTATAGSDATTSGNFDLAAALGDMLHAHATGGNFLIDIAPFLPLL